MIQGEGELIVTTLSWHDHSRTDLLRTNDNWSLDSEKQQALLLSSVKSPHHQ
jgi:hypothetical protein